MKLVLNPAERAELFERFLDAYEGDLSISVRFTAYDDIMERTFGIEYPSAREETLEIVFESAV
jgi:hypothetical protein